MLLRRWRTGNQEAGGQVMERLYPELRRLAAHYMRSERSDHTLQPTALVHELYLKLLSGTGHQDSTGAYFALFRPGQPACHPKKRSGAALVGFLAVSEKLADSLRRKAGILDNATDRERLHRVVPWDGHYPPAVGHDDVLALPRGVEASLFEGLDCPKVRDTGISTSLKFRSPASGLFGWHQSNWAPHASD